MQQGKNMSDIALAFLKNLKQLDSVNFTSDPSFIDSKTGNSCMAVYAIANGKQRRILLCITEEYEEDILTTKDGVDKSVVRIEEKLSILLENAHNQIQSFSSEEDFVLYR
jgi:hypothetical protein